MYKNQALPLLSFILIIFLFQSVISAQNNLSQNEKGYYLADRVIVKFKQKYNPDISGRINLPVGISKALKAYGVISAEKRFSIKRVNSKSAKELEKIVTLKLSSPFDPIFLSKKLSNMNEIIWAEPHYVDEIIFDPNDPKYLDNTLQQLPQIQADLAWDIQQGDSSIIIAINDTGVDWDHPDLADNIWVNEDETPGNGEDDDNNGYIDDIRGWDFGGLSGTPDNDPKEDRSDHGTHVAGIASAVTNNGTGIASIGFNCTIMPVKTSQDDIRFGNTALIPYGYEGIVYAVDNGAKVINCSWGNFYYSIASQEVINYAVENGALVVGAAGNDGLSNVIFPGGYDGALSVGATTFTDQKAGFSNYGRDVEVMAPGASIYSTWQNNTYATLNGTSMASPLVAGLAGLVSAQFPSYNPLQIAEQIRVNTDNIDALNPFIPEFFLGTGRINAYKSLSNISSKSVRATEIAFYDEGDGDGVFEPGETASIRVALTNYLSPTENLTATLEYTGSDISLNNSVFNAGAIATLSTVDNSSNKYSFIVDNSASQNTTVHFLLKYNDGSYDDFQWISVLVNPTYSTQSGNEVALTITSKGALGFNNYSSNTQGEGFKYQDGPNLLFEGALMFGNSSSNLLDAARSNDASIQSTDFSVIQSFFLNIPGEVADQQGNAIFNDLGAGAGSLGIETHLESFSYADNPYNKFIIIRYYLKNKSVNDVNALYTGLFFDWDIDESYYATNIAQWDYTDNFGYAHNQDTSQINTFVGCALLTSESYGFYAMNNDGSGGSINIFDVDGFADGEKWQTISNGISRDQSGPQDISFIASGGPYDIPAGETELVAFSIAAGENLGILRSAIQQSKVKYGSIPTSVKEGNNEQIVVFGLSQNYPNPFNPSTTIEFALPIDSEVSILLYNVLGQIVKEIVNRDYSAGRHNITLYASNLSSGVYFYILKAKGSNGTTLVSSKKMILLR